MSHEDEDHTRLWKDSLAKIFGHEEPNEDGEAILRINLSNAVDAIATIENLGSALLEYFADPMNIPDIQIVSHLEELRGHAGDLHVYLIDEGDYA